MWNQLWEYHQRGWPVVPQIGKVPKIKGWPQFAYEMPTDTLVKSWKGKEFDGIGLVLGPVSNLCVIDLDVRATFDGTKVWDIDFDHPLLSKTPSGGYHIYYKRGPERHKLEIIEGVEYFSDECKITLPPSMGKYNWINFNPEDVPEFPYDFITLDVPKVYKEYTGRMKSSPQLIASILEKHSHVNSGRRTETAVTIVSSLIYGGVKDEREIQIIIRRWNAVNTEPLTEEELQHQVFPSVRRFLNG